MLTFEGDKRYHCCATPVPILTCEMGGAQEVIRAYCNMCGADVTARARELRRPASNPDAVFLENTYQKDGPRKHAGAETAMRRYIDKASAYDSGDEATLQEAQRTASVLCDIIGRLHKRGLLTDADIADITGFEVAEK